jgi:hypothetical protein
MTLSRNETTMDRYTLESTLKTNHPWVTDTARFQASQILFSLGYECMTEGNRRGWLLLVHAHQYLTSEVR